MKAVGIKMEIPWEKTTRHTKTKMDRQSKNDFKRNWNTRYGSSIAQDRDGWKLICVAVIGLNGLKKTEKKEKFIL